MIREPPEGKELISGAWPDERRKLLLTCLMLDREIAHPEESYTVRRFKTCRPTPTVVTREPPASFHVLTTATGMGPGAAGRSKPMTSGESLLPLAHPVERRVPDDDRRDCSLYCGRQ
jgi:hypothetical protein